MDFDKINDGFGPITERRHKEKKRIMSAQIYMIIAFVTAFLVYRKVVYVELYSAGDFYFVAGAVLVMLVSEFIRRCSLYAEECSHVDERYGGSKMAAFQDCLSLTTGKAVIAIVVAVSAKYSIQSWYNQEEFVFPVLLYIIVALCISLSGNLLDMEQTTAVEISTRDESIPKNVSAGIAWGYYLGYLKFVLPSLPETFKKAEGEHFQVDGKDICAQVTDTSLFIIIPKDGYCYKDFSHVDKRITFEHTMPEIARTIGGQKRRVYKNSLYKIEIPGKRVKYAVMEYASPLLSLYDMARSSQVPFPDAEKEQEIVQFYIRLKEMIDDDPECEGRCKFILTGPVATNDIDDQTKFADIIWKEIEDGH